MAMTGWVGAGMEVVDGMHAGQSQGCWAFVWRGRSISRIRGDKLMTPDHTTSRCAALGGQELVGLPGKASTRDARRRLRFVFHEPVSFTPWCSVDASVRVTTSILQHQHHPSSSSLRQG